MAKIVGQLKAILGLDKSKYEKGMKSAQKQGDKFGKHMKKLGGLIAGFFAFAKLFQGIKNLIQKNAEFGQSLADLSAITGAVGGDLKFYEKEARKIGATTTLAASEAVKAFELMGSARPELLKNKEALAAVTKEAVILAEASGMDLPAATEALAKAMNQFNVPANEAARVINVLAAGSKEGAEAIPGLTESIKWMGTVADMAGISLETSVGLLETLAEKALVGSKSGNQLRNVILQLQTGADRFNPKIVGMTQALKNLAAENLSATKMTEMFGRENVTAAAILINNADKVESYTKAVTGTNVAYEQQAIKVDTVKGKWKGLLSVIEANMLQGDKFRNTIKGVIEGITNLISVLNKESKALELEKRQLNELVGVVTLEINTKEERLELIKKLQRQYPDFLKNLRAETVTNQELRDRLIEVNKAYDERIKAAVRQELLAKYAKKLTRSLEGQEAAQKRLAWLESDAAKNLGARRKDQIRDTEEVIKKRREERKEIQAHIDDLLKLLEVTELVNGGGGGGGDGKPKIPRISIGKIPSIGAIPQLQYTPEMLASIEGMNQLILMSAQNIEYLSEVTKEGQLVLELFAGMGTAIANAFMETEDPLQAFGEFFGQFIKRMIGQLIGATIAALALAAILSAIGIGAPLGLAKGASFKNLFSAGFGKFAGFQHGGTVPSGFPSDTFPAMLTSGETVLTPNQFNNLRDNRPINIGAKVIGVRGRELRILIGREDEFMTNSGS